MKRFAILYLACSLMVSGVTACSSMQSAFDQAAAAPALKIENNLGHATVFAIDETDTHYILATAKHVSDMRHGVAFNGDPATPLTVNGVEVEFLDHHPLADVAVMQVPKSVGPMRVYEIAEEQIGECKAIGYPGLTMDRVVTHGEVVSFTGDHTHLLLVDIQAAPGMSGGPLVQNGKVIGIVSRSAVTWGVPHFGFTYFEPATQLFDIYEYE